MQLIFVQYSLFAIAFQIKYKIINTLRKKGSSGVRNEICI